MATETDILNLTAARMGEAAGFSASNPAEESILGQQMALFYPGARDELLEMGDYKFSRRRFTGALVALPAVYTNKWAYAYAWPNQALKVMAVLPPYSLLQDDSDAQPFTVETLSNGDMIVLTNQEEAVLRTVQRITDTSKFSPLFVSDLSILLGSYMAGPIYKGETGMKIGAAMYKTLMVKMGFSTTNDANQSKNDPDGYTPSAVANR